ncbi:hypothetical protein KCU65_g7381, partial [Aureobasidium melanogenum]
MVALVAMKLVMPSAALCPRPPTTCSTALLIVAPPHSSGHLTNSTHMNGFTNAQHSYDARSNGFQMNRTSMNAPDMSQSLYNSDTLSDITIKFNGRQICAHKAILAHKSAYFMTASTSLLPVRS